MAAARSQIPAAGQYKTKIATANWPPPSAIKQQAQVAPSSDATVLSPKRSFVSGSGGCSWRVPVGDAPFVISSPVQMTTAPIKSHRANFNVTPSAKSTIDATNQQVSLGLSPLRSPKSCSAKPAASSKHQQQQISTPELIFHPPRVSKLVSPRVSAAAAAVASPTPATRLIQHQLNPASEMGDRLSTQQRDSQATPTNKTQMSPQVRSLADELSAGDSWRAQNGVQCSSQARELRQRKVNSDTTYNNNSQPASANGFDGGNSNLSQQQTKLTPRLPRGVSKIPHQVAGEGRQQASSQHTHPYQRQAPQSADSNRYKQAAAKVNHHHQVTPATQNGNVASLAASSEPEEQDKSRYLTFNKDQATSHFKSLKEELQGSLSPRLVAAATNPSEPLPRQQQQTNQQQQQQQQVVKPLNSYQQTYSHNNNNYYNSNNNQNVPLTYTKIPIDSQPPRAQVSGHDPAKRQQEEENIYENGSWPSLPATGPKQNNNITNNQEQQPVVPMSVATSNRQQQQQHHHHHHQPVCEAFIMTGQSMMKLSCSESENTTTSISNDPDKSKLQQHYQVNNSQGSDSTAQVNINVIEQSNSNSNTRLERPGNEMNRRPRDEVPPEASPWSFVATSASQRMRLADGLTPVDNTDNNQRHQQQQQQQQQQNYDPSSQETHINGTRVSPLCSNGANWETSGDNFVDSSAGWTLGAAAKMSTQAECLSSASAPLSLQSREPRVAGDPQAETRAPRASDALPASTAANATFWPQNADRPMNECMASAAPTTKTSQPATNLSPKSTDVSNFSNATTTTSGSHNIGVEAHIACASSVVNLASAQTSPLASNTQTEICSPIGQGNSQRVSGCTSPSLTMRVFNRQAQYTISNDIMPTVAATSGTANGNDDHEIASNYITSSGTECERGDNRNDHKASNGNDNNNLSASPKPNAILNNSNNTSVVSGKRGNSNRSNAMDNNNFNHDDHDDGKGNSNEITRSSIEESRVSNETSNLKAVSGNEMMSSSTSSSKDSPDIAPDRDSARRLAKRLYNLSGFKRSDVCHHLAKCNPFSQMVAEEYLNLFDFRSMKLDAALRKFLSKLQLTGETQERERMLSIFSQRYYDCNKEKFPTSDVVQTLVCALILLNTDLHGGHESKKSRKNNKLTLNAFVDGLNSSVAAMSRSQDQLDARPVGPGANGKSLVGYTFPNYLLVDMYESIKKRPLKCGADDKLCDMSSFEAELDKIYNTQQMGGRSSTLPSRRFAPGSHAPSSTLSGSARRRLKRGLVRLNGSAPQETEATIEFRSGYLNRKRVMDARGKPTPKGRRGWRRFHVIVRDLRLIMRLGVHEPEVATIAEATTSEESGAVNLEQANGANDQSPLKSPNTKQPAQSPAKSSRSIAVSDIKNSAKIHHTFAYRSTSYTKREHVFHLRLADQTEFLLQAGSEQEMQSWIDTINFASACLSSPALPSAISSPKSKQSPTSQQRRASTGHRALLPVAYTRLSYWEQLIDHEERLQRLKVELDEHLAEAPQTRNANKRDKTEFIDKIAYLKQEIERYSVYVDMMRKKSNSPEAIILSKHPQIASLTPSEEMIKSLPSFAPANSLSQSADNITKATTGDASPAHRIGSHHHLRDLPVDSSIA